MQNSLSLVPFLAQKLITRKTKIVTAESCTGGLLAGLLTALPNSSAWFDRGFVTYSNAAKEEMLDVSQSLLSSHGPISEEVAKAMALGALVHSAATVSVAITGIAGPAGGGLEKPVGTVYIACAEENLLVNCTHYIFKNTSREHVRQRACYYALKRLIAFL